jgi:putative CocE/NonD family hydrolase
LRFFDQHLQQRDTGLATEKPIHYFTIGEEIWKSAESWPPPAARETAFYLAPSRSLLKEHSGADDASDDYRTDFGCGTGRFTRYERLSAKPVETYYADWHGRDARMLCYTALPFDENTEVTGHPRIDLYMASSARDAGIFVYLEDVAPDGECRYVTEGMLRALHRKVTPAPKAQQVVGPFHSFAREDAELLVAGEPALMSFSLLPISWLFRRGHAVRLAIAAGDKDHFAHIPYGDMPSLTIYRDQQRPSHLVLPVVERAGG